MMCGLLMIASASSIDHYLGDPVSAQMSQSSNDAREGDEGVLNVSALTGMFLVLYLLMATQDIAVDGWALNMLQRGVNWRREANRQGCLRVTRTCYYEDYPYGPPDLMFTKLSAKEFEAHKSTYSSVWMVPAMYTIQLWR